MQKITAILALSLLLTGCCECSSYADKMKDKAQDAALREFNKYCVQCKNGSDYNICVLLDKKWVFEQYKEALIYITESTTEADRLNGFEWTGEVELRFDVAYRSFTNGKWSEWANLDVKNPPSYLPFRLRAMEMGQFGLLVAQVQKRKGGEWEVKFENVNEFASSEIKRITCADVPDEQGRAESTAPPATAAKRPATPSFPPAKTGLNVVKTMRPLFDSKGHILRYTVEAESVCVQSLGETAKIQRSVTENGKIVQQTSTLEKQAAKISCADKDGCLVDQSSLSPIPDDKGICK